MVTKWSRISGDRISQHVVNAPSSSLFQPRHHMRIRVVVGIMERVAKINGVILDRSLVTVDRRAMKFDEPVTFNIEASTGRLGIDELAKVIQENDRPGALVNPESG